ncbi:MAG: purine-nucleoside phosphorylase [Bacteroidales bacterium]|nr:purine-nucleoside phosphorylase [Bacteroidales bacterium]
MLEKIQQTGDFLRNNVSILPKIAIVLGSGLGGLTKEIIVSESFEYKDIPNFPVSTVVGHGGKLIFGTINGVSIMAMQGRFHFYEGYHMQDVTFPIRVMKNIGIETVILSNASGGMNPSFNIGDIMVITDHINMFPTNPLMGKNFDELGPRFPDMSEVYDNELIAKAENIAQKHKIKIQKGIYVGVSGPCFETPAEYKMFRIVGGDVVGMSTVPEAIVSRHSGMKTFALSVVTDLGVDGQICTVSHKEVLEAANKAEPLMTTLIKDLLLEISHPLL